MGCCQPAEFNGYSYEYPSDKVLQSNTLILPPNPHYISHTLRSSLSPKNKLPDKVTKIQTALYKSPKKVLTFKDFQTPKERKTRINDWNFEEIELHNLYTAYQNEDLSFLFTLIKNERLFKQEFFQIEHSWAQFPQTIGQLACILISNVLESYLNEQINEMLLKELDKSLQEFANDNIFLDFFCYLQEELKEKRCYKLEHAFLMISLVLEFIGKFSLKEHDILLQILLEYMAAFNLGGFKERKAETLLLTLDILRKLHKKNNAFCSVLCENTQLISRTVWFLFENTKEMYSYDEQTVIWFRIVNFIEEITKKDDGARIKELITAFSQNNLRDLLKLMRETLVFCLNKGKFEKDTDKDFGKNVLDYIDFTQSQLLECEKSAFL